MHLLKEKLEDALIFFSTTMVPEKQTCKHLSIRLKSCTCKEWNLLKSKRQWPAWKARNKISTSETSISFFTKFGNSLWFLFTQFCVATHGDFGEVWARTFPHKTKNMTSLYIPIFSLEILSKFCHKMTVGWKNKRCCKLCRGRLPSRT